MIQLRSAILLLSIFLLPKAVQAAAQSIDAQHFDANTIQKSSSGRIYSFESSHLPKTGSLILIFDHDKPVMAFRILKNDAHKMQFVGKRVRRYDEAGELGLHQSYTAIEKIADSLPPPPTIAPSDLVANADLDLASPTKASASPSIETTKANTPATEKNEAVSNQNFQTPPAEDPELDSSSTAALNKIDENDTTPDEDLVPLEVEEIHRIEPYNNIFSISGGIFANSANFNLSSIINSGMSISFTHAFLRDVFIEKQVSKDDNLAVEFGAIFYTMVNHDLVSDVYNMLPFYVTLMYQLHFSPQFSFNIYGGLQYDKMLSAVNPGKSLALLQGVQPDLGIGFFYSFGPQWLLRTDLGWDRITAGLCIKW